MIKQTVQECMDSINALNQDEYDANWIVCEYLCYLIGMIHQVLGDQNNDEITITFPQQSIFVAYVEGLGKKYKMERVVEHHGDMVRYVVGVEEVLSN